MRSHRGAYECRECSTTVNPYTYRANCPECGGPLRESRIP
ncbi:rubrerythrin-like domain-containing protein [Halosolutus gelatinilyticus]|nr:rubrerythrin-like domain-containing protein [Halosolutus gelatinilyticus]